MLWPRTMIMPQTNRTYQTVDNMKAVDTNVDSIIVVEDLEVEDDSLEIVTIDHEDRSNVLHATEKDIGMQTVHIKTEPT